MKVKIIIKEATIIAISTVRVLMAASFHVSFQFYPKNRPALE